MAHLGLQERRLRRFAAAYEAVFGSLPRDKRGHREFTPEAVERIAVALPLLIERPALGMEDVLRRQAGGEGVVPAATPGPADAVPVPELAELLAELHADVAALRREVAELRRELSARKHGEISTPLTARDDLQDQQLEAPAVAVADEPVDFEGATVLLVREPSIPQRLKNDLRWSSKRYQELEELLADAGRLELRKTNGKETWRTPTGKTIRRDTVLRLYGVGVLGQVPDMTNSL